MEQASQKRTIARQERKRTRSRNLSDYNVDHFQSTQPDPTSGGDDKAFASLGFWLRMH